MEPIKCFFLVPSDKERVSLRRYSSSDAKCPANQSYHNAEFFIGDGPLQSAIGMYAEQPPRNDARWPRKCQSCDYEFSLEDQFQIFRRTLYYRADTGALLTLNEAPAGAMWFADWMGERWRGPDGHCLAVRVPRNHDWLVDGYASNCDSPCANCGRPRHSCPNISAQGERDCPGYIDARPHKCWVRHGVPPEITADKNGITCGAGAGSIQTAEWHGYLRGGYLVL